MSKPIRSGIYYIKNIKTDEYYIGQSNHIHGRLKNHLNLLKNNKDSSKLQKSFNEYGISHFQFGVLEYAPLEQLNSLEEKYICQFDSINNGFNVHSIGFNGKRGVYKGQNPQINISCEVKEVLTNIGSKNQSYDDIIRMLLQNYDESITFENVK